MKLFAPEHFDVLYKYVEEKNIDNFLLRGIFRVGTLYEYRAQENAEVGDPDEGMKQFAFLDPALIAGLTAGELMKLHPRLKFHPNFLSKVVLAKERAAERIPIAIEVHAPNCYVFCMTRTFDLEVMRKFGYDACLKITWPRGLFRELTNAMAPFASYAAMQRCEYGPKHGEPSNHTDHRPQIMKSERFRHQDEVRMLWDPINIDHQTGPAESWLDRRFVTIPAALRLIQRVA